MKEVLEHAISLSDEATHQIMKEIMELKDMSYMHREVELLTEVNCRCL